MIFSFGWGGVVIPIESQPHWNLVWVPKEGIIRPKEGAQRKGNHIIDGYPSMIFIDGPSMIFIDGYPSMIFIDGYPLIFIDGYPSMNVNGYPVL